MAERTDRNEATARDEPVGAPAAGFASVTRRGGAKRSPPEAKPEGLTEAKGAVRSTALRTDIAMDWTRARRPVGARVGAAAPRGGPRPSRAPKRARCKLPLSVHGEGRAGKHRVAARVSNISAQRRADGRLSAAASASVRRPLLFDRTYPICAELEIARPRRTRYSRRVHRAIGWRASADEPAAVRSSRDCPSGAPSRWTRDRIKE
jgi:hypothetical protein